MAQIGDKLASFQFIVQMAKCHSQQSLLDMWSQKHPKPDATSDNSAFSMSETVSESEVRVESFIPSGTETSSSVTGSTAETNVEGTSQPNCSACILPCCTDPKPFQPVNSVVLANLANKDRNFVVDWFKQFPWLTLCLTKKKVFCVYCRYISQHQLLTFSKNFSPAFISDGFNNWKKSLTTMNPVTLTLKPE